MGGIEFDDSHASVLDDDGATLAAASNPVRLGMTVDVQGGDVSTGANGPIASASAIQWSRLAVGPVTSVDMANGTLTVLGQVLQSNGSTVYDAAIRGGLTGLHAGDAVCAYALADALGRPVATRIELASASEPWRLRGFASSVDAQTRRLVVGSAQLDYGTATNPPADLMAGQFVHLRINGAGVNGVLQVGSFLPSTRAPSDAARVVTEGVVAAPVAGVSFRLGALSVDARTASVSPQGATWAAGEQVQVQGHLQGGSFVAEAITVISPQGKAKRTYQLVGSPSSLDLVAQTFVVRGVGVDYGAAQFVNGTLASLSAANVTVRVQGTLSADGSRVRAQVVSFP